MLQRAYGNVQRQLGGRWALLELWVERLTGMHFASAAMYDTLSQPPSGTATRYLSPVLIHKRLGAPGPPNSRTAGLRFPVKANDRWEAGSAPDGCSCDHGALLPATSSLTTGAYPQSDPTEHLPAVSRLRGVLLNTPNSSYTPARPTCLVEFLWESWAPKSLVAGLYGPSARRRRA